MNILHVITTIERGGAEKQLLKLVEAQLNAGNHVSIIYLKGKPELLPDFKAIGAVINSSYANQNPVIQTFRLRNQVRREKFLVHAHLPRAELIVSLASRTGGYIYSRHNSEPFFPGAPSLLSRSLGKMVSRKAFKGIMISQAVLDFCKENSEIAQESRVQVIHYGIENPTISLRVATSSEDKEVLIFGTACRLVEQKNLFTLLTAFSKHLQSYPRDQLEIVGAGPLLDELLSHAQALGINSNVKWLGRIVNVDDFYLSLDVFVLPSLYEGFGLVLLEAMRCGLPIVASDISAIPEVVGQENGLFFDPNNADDLASKLEMCRDSNVRSKMANNSLRRTSDFSLHTMCEAISEILVEMAEAK